MDNCYRENKNRFLLTFGETLVGLVIFREVFSFSSLDFSTLWFAITLRLPKDRNYNTLNIYFSGCLQRIVRVN